MNFEQQQLANIGRAKLTVDRAKAYATSLASHAAELRVRIDAAQASAVVGDEALLPTDFRGLRAELAEVDKQHGIAAATLVDAEAEYDRHRADLDAMLGVEGQARAALAGAQRHRTTVQSRVAAASDILDRAGAHVDALERALADAQGAEARLDREASERVRQALQTGDAVVSGRAIERVSVDLEDNLRAARLTVDQLTREHANRLADLADADREVAGAVDAVLAAEAEHVAHELEATEIRAAMLRRRLTTYTERRPVAYVAPVAAQAPAKQHPGGWYYREPDLTDHAAPAMPRSALITRLVGGSLKPMLAGAPVPDRSGAAAVSWRQEADAWSGFADALKADACAEPVFPVTPASAAVTNSAVIPVTALPVVADAQVAAYNLRARDRKLAQQGRFVA